jgi:phospholipid/cholesterol/gamma-HCH transport system substrate-binding protein
MGRRNVVEVLTGAIVLVVAAGFLAYALAHSGRSAGSGYELSAKFDHIDGLGVGADVRVAGVKVGAVVSEQIDPKSFEAVVDFTVRNDIRLPKDSAAIITSESLLGGKYISVQPGGDEAILQPGQSITITQGSVSIEELLGKFIFSMTNAPKPGQAQPGQAQPAQKP